MDNMKEKVKRYITSYYTKNTPIYVKSLDTPNNDIETNMKESLNRIGDPVEEPQNSTEPEGSE